MSIPVFEWVLNQHQVQGPEKVVFFVLAWRMNETTGLCCPRIEQIALDAGLGQSSVRRHLKSLQRRGLIASSSRYGGALGRRSNQYDFPTFRPTAQSEQLVSDLPPGLSGRSATKRSNSIDLPLGDERPTARSEPHNIKEHKEHKARRPTARSEQLVRTKRSNSIDLPPGAREGAGGNRSYEQGFPPPGARSVIDELMLAELKKHDSNGEQK